MPHEILVGEDGKARAMYARRPAWHNLGHVKEEGWFSAEEALAVLNPEKEPVRKVDAFARFTDEKGEVVEVKSTDSDAIIRKIDGAWKVLSFMGTDYGVVQLEDQFRFLDEVVGAIGGAHYETAGLLRGGKQVFVTIATDALILDAGGIADRVDKFILGANSYDGSLAFRAKMTNVRVECANLLACALRGSSDQVVSGDWSTRHTRDVMARAEMAKRTLGLYKEYNDRFFADGESMIHTKLTDNQFSRIIEGLFEVTQDDGVTKEVNQETIGQVKALYELNPRNEKLVGTVWGGLQSVTEWADWYAKARGGSKTSMAEARFRTQLEDKGSLKQRAWDAFKGLVNA